MRGAVPISVEQEGRRFTRWDALAILLTLGLLVFVAEASRHLLQPLSELQQAPVSLDPANLPEYAVRTTLRMLVALGCCRSSSPSPTRPLAAKSRRAEVLLIPLLDILQSVPILGFISVTVVFFMSLAPGRVLGAEFAGDLRDLHQPGLEHGVQLLSVAAHGAGRSGGSLAQLPAVALAALLAARGAVRDAAARSGT